MAKKKAKKKDSKKKGSKKKDSKKKKIKKAVPIKKERKKKDQKKKESKKKKSKNKKVQASKLPDSTKNPIEKGKKAIDHSSNYNVRLAVQKLRSLKTPSEIQAFTEGEKRITVTKAVPAAVSRVTT